MTANQTPSSQKKTRILFSLSILAGIIIWVLFGMALNLPQNGNQLPYKKDTHYFSVQNLGIEDEMMLYHQKGLIMVNFKKNQVRTVNFSKRHSLLYKILYWKSRKLIYILTTTGKSDQFRFQIIHNATTPKVVSESELASDELYKIKGWYIDTVRQQLVTIEEYDYSTNNFVLNYRDNQWKIQKQDTVRVLSDEGEKVPKPGNSTKMLYYRSIEKVGNQLYFYGHRSGNAGIFALKKMPNNRYRDSLIISTSGDHLDIPFNYGDTLLTTQGIRYEKKPSFLPQHADTTWTSIFHHLKNEGVIYQPTFYNTADQQQRAYYTSIDDERYLKQVVQGSPSKLKQGFHLVDKQGKRLVTNFVSGYWGKLNAVVLGNEIILHNLTSRNRYARFDRQTLQRIDPPTRWFDLQDKLSLIVSSNSQKAGYYFLIPLLLLGFPFICLLAFRHFGWLSSKIRSRIGWFYLVAAIVSILLERNFLMYYF